MELAAGKEISHEEHTYDNAFEMSEAVQPVNVRNKKNPSKGRANIKDTQHHYDDLHHSQSIGFKRNYSRWIKRVAVVVNTVVLIAVIIFLAIREGIDQSFLNIDGGWSTWGSWSGCSASCGTGMAYRNRSCSNPKPRNGGGYCLGESGEYQLCNKMSCTDQSFLKIDGGWSTWESWSECSASCGAGMASRNRSCSNPKPRNGEDHCLGESAEYKLCNKMSCPENDGAWNEWGSWSECSSNDWGSWSECSSTWGYGMERRQRNCSDVTGHRCYGETTEYRICKTELCPDCEAIYRSGTRYDGVYDISPHGQKSFSVFCDMTNGGWTLIQKRIDDSVPFNRTWSEYETGFGDLQGSHWLGLEKIHRLTRNGSQIRLDMERVDGSKVYAQYKSFSVDDATTAYTMHVNTSGYNGSIPEYLSYHDGMKFSTLDQDSDASTSTHCSQKYGYGGWWYKNCYKLVNLNGLYGIKNGTGFAFYDHSTYWYLKTASIKVKGL